MKMAEYRMKQSLLKDMLAHYKHKYQDDFLEIVCTDLRGYIDDNRGVCSMPSKQEIDSISRPFLKSFVNSHGIILQMSAWIASMSYENALECYCKLCLCD